jgi:hypothetical protein
MPIDVVKRRRGSCAYRRRYFNCLAWWIGCYDYSSMRARYGEQ